MHVGGEGGDRDVNLVQAGISEKVGSFLQYFSMFLTGFIIGFVKNWKLSLVILSVVPLLMAGGAFFGKILSEASTSGQTAYAKAGGVAEEVLGGIRTIVAFSSEDRSADRYRDKLDESLKTGIRKGHYIGLGLGYGAPRTGDTHTHMG
jgi:ABC-type multidrug transport system fused ATPase/permease subunit